MKYKTVFKKIGSILGHIFTVVLIILLCFNLYNLVATHFFGVDTPSVFGVSNAIVISGSMSGTLEVNDMIIIQSKKSYSKDDIITFRHQGSLVTHRIVEITDEGFRTQGDANNTDEAVNRDDVVGKVIFVIPKIGRIIEALRTPLGIIGAVLAIFILINLPTLAGAIVKRKGTNKNE